MPRKFSYNDEYDYDYDDEYEDPKRAVRKLRKEPDIDAKKKWERDREFDRDHDYDERR